MKKIQIYPTMLDLSASSGVGLKNLVKTVFVGRRKFSFLEARWRFVADSSTVRIVPTMDSHRWKTQQMGDEFMEPENVRFKRA